MLPSVAAGVSWRLPGVGDVLARQDQQMASEVLCTVEGRDRVIRAGDAVRMIIVIDDRTEDESTATPTAVKPAADTHQFRHSYAEAMTFTRIRIDHRIMGGLPCLAGTRIPVAMIVRMFEDEMTAEEILADYPQLVEDDIREALRFAAASVDQRVVPLDPTTGAISSPTGEG